jgi:membrane-associated PAP2 superfamily phosphatase
MTAESGAVHLSCWYNNNNSNSNNNNNNKYDNNNDNHRWNKLLVHRKVFILAVLMAVCALGQAAVNLTYRKVKTKCQKLKKVIFFILTVLMAVCGLAQAAEDSKVLYLVTFFFIYRQYVYEDTDF